MSIKLFYYIKRFGYNELPSFYFKRKFKRLKKYEAQCDQKELNDRLNYYFRFDHHFDIPKEAVLIKNYKRSKGTDYYLDLKDYLHYFSPETRFSYRFGDETKVNPFPTLTKARPIDGDNAYSVLFKLNKRRHFRWVSDPHAFADKQDAMVWRGGAYKKLRRDFVKLYWDHPLCNVGQTNKPKEDVPWQKNFLSINEQLKYKFIFCPEGNDVATNLKWAMSSNSLCFMPKPRYETWFMEGLLKTGVHYVEIANDFSDIKSKILYYSTHTNEAEQIIENAHRHVERFKDPYLEDLLCLKVLERYADLSGQANAMKFRK